MSSIKAGFKRLDNLTKWIGYVLYAQILLAVLAIIFQFIEYQLLSAFQQGIYASLANAYDDGELAIEILQIIGMASLLAFIASAVLILQWIYRANNNVRQLGAQKMNFTPAWSIAYYFIPVFNLWKPYQAMKEIWLASKNAVAGDLSKSRSILPLWWTLWLASNLLGQSIFRLSASAEKLPELINFNLISQASNLLDILLAIVTYTMIKVIYRMQTSHKE
ncbi:hypothetical protein CXF72_09870 [Psychromonas sp. MB-3u-54]|uniref:DUF4328 domain-containing protein n=1 Tax=Psychromonas sp. MB-3u-54 TaxID=2058319 RepID=UPI000C338B9D|nr:DUF4328 domain-containing protein [Psychromonas sp. MB-3u-54]PKH02757.1 hypothetical protein CXF72_09870 [Psychromonas sp. MB-3u-54]